MPKRSIKLLRERRRSLEPNPADGVAKTPLRPQLCLPISGLCPPREGPWTADDTVGVAGARIGDGRSTRTVETSGQHGRVGLYRI